MTLYRVEVRTATQADTPHAAVAAILALLRDDPAAAPQVTVRDDDGRHLATISPAQLLGDPLPETAMDRHWKEYEDALGKAQALAQLSEGAWEGADRHSRVVTYGDSGVPCHEVAAMFAAQAQAWAAVAAARYLPLHPPGMVG